MKFSRLKDIKKFNTNFYTTDVLYTFNFQNNGDNYVGVIYKNLSAEKPSMAFFKTDKLSTEWDTITDLITNAAGSSSYRIFTLREACYTHLSNFCKDQILFRESLILSLYSCKKYRDPVAILDNMIVSYKADDEKKIIKRNLKIVLTLGL